MQNLCTKNKQIGGDRIILGPKPNNFRVLYRNPIIQNQRPSQNL